MLLKPLRQRTARWRVVAATALVLLVHSSHGMQQAPDSRLHAGKQCGHSLDKFIALLPKAELHVHVEGTLEAEMMLALAARNNVSLPYADVAAARAARAHYTSLSDFLREYEFGMNVLRTRADFYDLASAYLARAARDNVKHVELFFDAQAHLERGIAISQFLPGLRQAMEEAQERHGISATLINCFVRDRGPQAAVATLKQLKPHLASIRGVGLDSAEVGNPPSLFKPAFDEAAQLGLGRVAHAGEEGGPDYVWGAIRELAVQRIDHGIHSLEDPKLVAYLEKERLPITLCPLSNQRLQVYAGTLEARLRQLLATNIVVTVNSDDPAYFLPDRAAFLPHSDALSTHVTPAEGWASGASAGGSYINANFAWLARVAGLGAEQLAQLACNSFQASLTLPESEKARYCAEIDEALAAWEGRAECPSSAA